MPNDAENCEICTKGLEYFRDALDAYHHEYDGVEDEAIAECEKWLRELTYHLTQMHNALESVGPHSLRRT